MEIIATVMTAIALLAGGAELPYWVDAEVHAEHAECGACGTEIESYQMVLSYDETEWVEVCPECFELFATEER